MSQLLSLGAINKQTGEYVYPKIANKKDEYICPECNKDLILCQGEIRVHHFRHKVDNVNPCHHYSNPTESQIHKEAQILLKNVLERKIPLELSRSCVSCRKNDEWEIPEMTEGSVIELEHRFEFNGLKIADVAYIDNNEIFCVFEIYNTHKTSSEKRKEPWFEIDALSLIQKANDIELSSLQLSCIRCEKCEDCIEECLKKDKINQILQEIKNLNEILGSITSWGASNSEKNKKSKIRSRIKILQENLESLSSKEPKLTITKEEKITKLKEELKNIGSARSCRSNIDSDDDADIMRSMRYDKQDSNHKESLLNEMKFIENDIIYELMNNVILIEHPLTHTKIRKSLVSKKTFYKGVWRTDITINLLIKWYKSNYDIIDEL